MKARYIEATGKPGETPILAQEGYEEAVKAFEANLDKHNWNSFLDIFL